MMCVLCVCVLIAINLLAIPHLKTLIKLISEMYRYCSSGDGVSFQTFSDCDHQMTISKLQNML